MKRIARALPSVLGISRIVDLSSVVFSKGIIIAVWRGGLIVDTRETEGICPVSGPILVGEGLWKMEESGGDGEDESVKARETETTLGSVDEDGCSVFRETPGEARVSELVLLKELLKGELAEKEPLSNEEILRLGGANGKVLNKMF